MNPSGWGCIVPEKTGGNATLIERIVSNEWVTRAYGSYEDIIYIVGQLRNADES